MDLSRIHTEVEKVVRAAVDREAANARGHKILAQRSAEEAKARAAEADRAKADLKGEVRRQTHDLTEQVNALGVQMREYRQLAQERATRIGELEAQVADLEQRVARETTLFEGRR